jgi:hypothetical protein
MSWGVCGDCLALVMGGAMRRLLDRRNFVWGILVFVSSGCGSSYDLGRVSGVVRLDGEPLSGATVTFSRGEGRMSVGTTDAAGRYTLQYTSSVAGAEPGKHTVAITSQIEAVSGEGDAAAVAGREELLPARYHTQSELRAEVKPGGNQIDFDLQSAGK